MTKMPGFTDEAAERMEAALKASAVQNGDRDRLRQDIYGMQRLAMKWRFAWGVLPQSDGVGQPPS